MLAGLTLAVELGAPLIARKLTCREAVAFRLKCRDTALQQLGSFCKISIV